MATVACWFRKLLNLCLTMTALNGLFWAWLVLVAVGVTFESKARPNLGLGWAVQKMI